ncbi:MAG: hypothetical protein C0594_13145, partial [Marinilabiliales bacterium]
MRKITLLISLLMIATISFGQTKQADMARMAKHVKKGFSTQVVDIPVQAIQYRSIEAVEDTFYYCGHDVVGGVGYDAAGTFSVFLKINAADLTPYVGKAILGVQAGCADASNTASMTAHILNDSLTYNGDNPLVEGTLVDAVVDGWNDLPITMPILSAQDLWVGYEIVALGGFPAGTDGATGNIEGADLLYGGGWATLAGIPLDGNWSIKVLLGTPDGCLAPFGLSASNITTSSVDLDWQSSGATSFNIEYGPEGFTQGTGTMVNSITNPYALTGLVAGSYDFYVQADCNPATSDWAGPSTFVIPTCSAPSCFFYFDMVDTYGDGWNGASLDVYEDGVLSGTMTGPVADAAYDSVGVCGTGVLELVWNAGSWDSEITFSVETPYGTVAYTTGASTAADLLTDGQTFYVGESSCTAPTCPAPTALNAANITDSSADLGWTPGDSEGTWNLEWGPEGFTPGSGTMLTGITDNPYSLTGLAELTTYDFYIQADCGGGDASIWVGPYTFNTISLCGAVTLPWTEDFESAGNLADLCFSTIDNDGDGNDWMNSAEAGSFATHSGTNCATSSSWEGSALTPDNYLITPQLDLTSETGTTMLKWYVAAQDQTWPEEYYEVRVSTTGMATTDFADVVYSEIVEAGGPEGNDYWFRTVNLSDYNGEMIYIAFVHTNCTNNYYLNIDDINVEEDTSIDGAVAGVVAPNNDSGCQLSASESVTVTIFNNGGIDLANFDVSYSVNGGALVTETVAGPITAASSFDYTFTTPADLSALGYYDIQVTLAITGDINAANDVFDYEVSSTDAFITVEVTSDNAGGQSWALINAA